MTPLAIGVGVLALCAALAVALWFWWASGHGRHRAPRRTTAPAPARVLLVTTDAPELPYGTEAPSQEPAVPSVLPPREGVEEAGGADPDTVALLEVDRADFAYCPAEKRRTPHFFHSNGARTCCCCETKTAGDQT